MWNPLGPDGELPKSVLQEFIQGLKHASAREHDLNSGDADAPADSDEHLLGDLGVEEDVDNGLDERVGFGELPKDKSFVDAGGGHGKYDWWEEDHGGDFGDGLSQREPPVFNEAIDRYSWSDGSRTVSIYVELAGLDAVSDSALVLDFAERRVSLTVLGVGAPPVCRRLTLVGLFEAIDDAKVDRKPGKDTVVLRLRKREQREWSALLGASNGEAWGASQNRSI